MLDRSFKQTRLYDAIIAIDYAALFSRHAVCSPACRAAIYFAAFQMLAA